MLRLAVVFSLAFGLKDIAPNLKFLRHPKLLKLQAKSEVNRNFLVFLGVLVS